jgi:hypothetical protein
MIRSALRRLEVSRITPIGVVLTKFDPKTVGYTYGYGYGYGYDLYKGYGDSYGRLPEVEDGGRKRIATNSKDQQAH